MICDPSKLTSEEEAVDMLAERLCFIMQKLEPEPDGDWIFLDIPKKDFLRLCIRDLLKERSTIQAMWEFMDAALPPQHR